MSFHSDRKRVADTARFDDSFAAHMIRDFFFVLVAVVMIELSVRFLLVVYDFHHNQQAVTRIAAERLASDIRSIMLNSGGPVAARTVYPILERNHEELGLAIAVEPSEITVSSIEAAFAFTPRGLPTAWPDGEHHEMTVNIVAEEFCISCHVTAQPGDVLGSVTVRSYLSNHLSLWWHEVQLTGLLGISKIVLHTIVLFFLLRIRMEPVLSLRSMIAQLAMGASDLSHRAPIRSRDEFGELARDLNAFLDRIDHVMEDLGDVLANVLVVNRRLTQVHDQMGHQFKKISTNVMTANENALRGQSIDMNDISNSLHEFRHFLEEMAVLEEKMRSIAAQGQTLLHRLKNVDENPQRDATPSAAATS